jgi:hypothetical protein
MMGRAPHPLHKPALIGSIRGHEHARWQGREGGQERANYQLFLTELADALGMPGLIPPGRIARPTTMCSNGR